jgi:hypothetical protein
MKKVYILSLLAGFFIFSNNLMSQQADATGFIRTYAQPGGMLSFDWVIGVPAGDMNEHFISETSTRGFSMEYRYMLNAPVSIGGGFTWQGFYEKKDRNTYELEGGAITTTRFNYLYNFPLFINVHYYPLKNNVIYPFIGLNAAMVSIDKKDQLGIYYVQDKSWQFALQPEIGALIQMNPGSGFGFVVKAKYNHLFYNKGVYNSLSHFDFHVGVAFVF